MIESAAAAWLRLLGLETRDDRRLIVSLAVSLAIVSAWAVARIV